MVERAWSGRCLGLGLQAAGAVAMVEAISRATGTTSPWAVRGAALLLAGAWLVSAVSFLRRYPRGGVAAALPLVVATAVAMGLPVLG